jgi:hypothetical protein
VAVAVSEIVGFHELFQMVPLSSDVGWHRALSFAMSQRQHSDHAETSAEDAGNFYSHIDAAKHYSAIF